MLSTNSLSTGMAALHRLWYLAASGIADILEKP
jgi:hypothetical protein